MRGTRRLRHIWSSCHEEEDVQDRVQLEPVRWRGQRCRLAPDVLTALEVCADSYGKSVKAMKVYDARESTPSRRAFKVEFSSDLSDGEASDVASDIAPDMQKTLEVCADSYGRSVGAVKVYDAQR